MLKRITILLTCFLILIFSIPSFSFADSSSNVPDGYSPCGLNDQVDAFKSYCQSRNLVVEGSGLDVVTAFTTNAYQGAVSKVGLDINQLQNEIYKRTKDNVGAKWFFTSTGIAAYNRIFAELLQNNDLEVGEIVDKTVYDGAISNGTLLYVFSSSGFASLDRNKILQYGTPLYNTNTIKSSNPFTFTFDGTNYSYPVYVRSDNFVTYSSSVTNPNNDDYGTNNIYKHVQYVEGTSYPHTYNVDVDGYIVIAKVSNVYYLGRLALGHYKKVYNGNGNIINDNDTSAFTQIARINDTSNITPATVTYTTNNTTINNNNYEGDTYITNEGDVVTNEPEPSPGGNNPGWNVGGGQGSYNDGQGNSYTINFPDFELPDLNIDWSIQGLGNKFPFSIPFDIVSLVTVLNAEPEAPRFQGTVNFGFTTWDYDINLQQFDTVAQVCRIAELLLLVFGLILITRSIIKG